MRYETYKQKSKPPISPVRVSYDMYRCAIFYYSIHSNIPLLFMNRNWFYLSSFFYLVKERKYLDTNVLKKKSGDHAVECLDFKVQDLRKKLNKLRYQARTKQQRIESLMKEYEKVVMINAEIEKAEEILEDSAEGQRLRYASYIQFNKFSLSTPWVDTIHIKCWIFSTDFWRMKYTKQTWS